MNSCTLRQRLWSHRHFYLFIAPFFVLFAIFGLYPIVFSLALSFAHWDGLTEIHWIGLNNFTNLFNDEILLSALWNTLALGLFYIPPMLIGAFLLALVLNSAWLRWRPLFRAAIFMPVVTPMIVVAIVFSLFFDFETGLLNYAIKNLGFAPVPWMQSEAWSKPSLALLLLWRWTGYNMVLMLAGLQTVPAEHYEAATIDGAGWFRRHWHVTVPAMRPVFAFCATMSLIGTVYLFDEIFVLTNGGPGTSSLNIGLYLFNLSFIDFNFGYASTVAYTVSTVIFFCSFAIFRLQRRDED